MYLSLKNQMVCKNKKGLEMNLLNSNLLSLFCYVKPAKWAMFLAGISSALNKICDILPEILLAVAVDTVVQQENSVTAKIVGIINPAHQLYCIAFATIALWILESVFEYLYSIMWHNVSQKTQHDLRLLTYQKIQSLDLAYFENQTIGGLLTILQDDISEIEQFLNKWPNEIIQLIVNILIIGIFFIIISPQLFLLTLLPIPFVIFIAYYFQHKLSLLYKSMLGVTSSMASHIVYRLQGLSTIKSYNTQDYELNCLRQESNKYKDSYDKVNAVTAQYIPCVRMIIMFGFIITMVVGGLKVLSGAIAVYWYAELVFLIQRFLWPFASLTNITDLHEKSQASAGRILNLLKSQPSIVDGPDSVDLRSCPGTIDFENVSFTYNGGFEVFNHLNLSIPQQTTVAFVGSTGSGKSTLAKLLLRFYDVQNGSIKINGHDIRNIKIKDLRASIGLVSQDVYIVDGTIADNIAYGTFQASRDEIIQAATMAQIHDFIIQLPQGYDTVLEEYGKKLSGGQRQRISIARALLKKSCLFIFDEATSALDNETEAEINKAMDQLKRNHTVIIIAHRLSTVRNADTIFVIDHGVVIESGSHEELLAKNGSYAQLWNMQLQ